MSDESKKQVNFPVWDQETDELVEMDEDDYKAMEEYEQKLEFERSERRKYHRELEKRGLRHSRD